MKTPSFHLPAVRTLAFAALLGAGALPPAARAVTYTWTGGGTSDGWSDNANWSSGARPNSNEDTSLIFGGSTRLTPNQNLGGTFRLNALTFSSSAGAYVLGGNFLSFRTSPNSVLPTLTQNSATAITINNGITLDNNLTIGGSGTGTLTLAGVITGASNLAKTGVGTTLLTGKSDYKGTTVVNGGTLAIGTGGGIVSQSVSVGAGATLALSGTGTLISPVGGSSLALDGASASVASATLGGTAEISTGSTTVGGSGYGAFTQNSGTHTLTGALVLASGAGGGNPITTTPASSGTYTLNGGTVSAASLTVGGGGNGTFTQSSGGVTISGAAVLGNQAFTGDAGIGFYTASASGTYTLADGTFSAASLTVGRGGSGTFTQSGGTLTVLGAVLLADQQDTRSGANYTYAARGSFSLAAGAFSAGSLTVGNGGSGSFAQSGGTATVNGTVALGVLGGGTTGTGPFTTTTTAGSGTLFLNGGTFQANQLTGGAGGSTVNLNGGTLTAGASDNPGASSNPTTFFAGVGTARVQAGGARIDSNGFNVTVAQPLLNGTASGTPDGGLTKLGAGTLTLTGANTFTGTTAVGAGTLALGNTSALLNSTLATASAGGAVTFAGSLNDFTLGGLSGSGNLILTNGAGGRATIAVGGNNASTAYSGALSGVGGLTKVGAGTLTLTGSSSYQDTTRVNGGTVVLGSGGSLTSGFVYIGDSATGAFNQTAGSFTTSSTFNVGFGPSANGTYTLGGAGSSLSTGTAYIGNNGTGTFTQTVGTFTTNGNPLYVGNNFGGSGTYALGGGSLTVGNAFIGAGGTGTFTQSGGVFSLGGNLLLGSTVGTGTYNLSAGNLSATGATIANYGTGVFNQTGGTFTVGSGGLLMGAESGSHGTYNLGGGTLTIPGITTGGNPGTFNFNGGTLRASGDSTGFLGGVAANVQAGGAVIDTQGFSVRVTQILAHDPALGSTVDGGLTKLGSGTLTLTRANTFTGPLNINAGTLAAASEGSLGTGGTVTVGGSGQLQFTANTTLARTYNLGIATLSVASGQTLTFGGGSMVNGGYLAGPGADALGNGAALNGVTTQISSTVTQTSGSTAALNNVTVRGTLSQTGGTLALNNATGTTSSRVTVGGTVNATGTELDGLTTVASGGALNTNGTSLYLGGGSHTTVNAGGTLAAGGGTSVELNGALLINNGTQTGALNVNFGSVAKGSGTFGDVTVGDGGRFSPGNSPGTASVDSLSFQSAGSYQFELNSAVAANATPGNGAADLTLVTQRLTISAGTTANSRFTVAIVSLDTNNNAAALPDFDASRSYRFVLVGTGAGIDGFSAGEFAVDASGFANGLAGGSFAVVQDGNNLDLVFTPVPEPGTWTLLGVGGVAVLLAARRRAGVLNSKFQIPNSKAQGWNFHAEA